MTEYIEFEPLAQRVGLAVLLPGRDYTPARPLLDFTTQACVEAGWQVRQSWWQPPAGHAAARPEGDPAEKAAWVQGELEAALSGAAADRLLIIGKSLGSFAAPYAAKKSLEAIWLTPVLTEPLVADAVQGNGARQLLVGGTEDPYWRSELSLPSDTESLTVAGADHSMTHVDGIHATSRIHLHVLTRLQSWLLAAITDA